MPLSEPMKAAIVLAIVGGLAIVLAAMKIADAFFDFDQCREGRSSRKLRFVGRFAGGLFEDRLDLD